MENRNEMKRNYGDADLRTNTDGIFTQYYNGKYITVSEDYSARYFSRNANRYYFETQELLAKPRKAFIVQQKDKAC